MSVVGELLASYGVLVLPVALGAALLLLCLSTMRSRSLARELDHSRRLARDDRRNGLATTHELKRSLSALKDENRELSDLNYKLPSLMKQLTADLDRRSLAPLILKVLEEIFKATQALVFFADDQGETLTLVSAVGLMEGGLRPGVRVRVGEGRIGFAARKQICMGPQDFRLESNINVEHIRATDLHGITADLCAPLVSNGRLLGVISMALSKEWASIEVKRLLGMVADVASLALASSLQYRKIQHLASSDPLTGISNKSYFMRRGVRVLRDATSAVREAGLLFMDLDHFKRFNDTYGHLAGDRVLRGLGDILQQHVREGDIAARFGGEEFVVMLADADLDTAERVAERIRVAVRNCEFDGLFRDSSECVTISIGVAMFPDDSRNLDELIGRADIALYRAKDAGRDTVCIYANTSVEGEKHEDGACRIVFGTGTEVDSAPAPAPEVEPEILPELDFSSPPRDALDPIDECGMTWEGGFLDALSSYDREKPEGVQADDDTENGSFLPATIITDES